jgi:hypothetical protein
MDKVLWERGEGKSLAEYERFTTQPLLEKAVPH